MRKATDPITEELMKLSKIAWQEGLNTLAAEERAERAETALRAWQRFAEHAADRKWSIPLWGALLWDQALGLTEAALPAHHATPQAGEEP